MQAVKRAGWGISGSTKDFLRDFYPVSSKVKEPMAILICSQRFSPILNNFGPLEIVLETKNSQIFANEQPLLELAWCYSSTTDLLSSKSITSTTTSPQNQKVIAQ